MIVFRDNHNENRGYTDNQLGPETRGPAVHFPFEADSTADKRAKHKPQNRFLERYHSQL